MCVWLLPVSTCILFSYLQSFPSLSTRMMLAFVSTECSRSSPWRAAWLKSNNFQNLPWESRVSFAIFLCAYPKVLIFNGQARKSPEGTG